MSNLTEYAKYELELAGLFDKDSDYNGMIADAVMELIKVFANQGHSGLSADITIDLFNKLARYENLIPLTFKDDEWIAGSYQNKRNPAVFKNGKDGRPYYLYAYTIIAVFPDGHVLKTLRELPIEDGGYIKRCYIKDPTNMPTVKIELKAHYNNNNNSADDWEVEPAKKEQIEELKKYYDLEIISR